MNTENTSSSALLNSSRLNLEGLEGFVFSAYFNHSDAWSDNTAAVIIRQYWEKLPPPKA